MTTMSTIRPQLRTMILCEAVVRDPEKPKQLSLLRLVSAIRSTRYPSEVPQLSVFAQLTECRGVVPLRIDVCHDETGTVVYTSPTARTPAGPDGPLAIRGVIFRMQYVILNDPGLYSVRLWHETELLGERPLLLH